MSDDELGLRDRVWSASFNAWGCRMLKWRFARRSQAAVGPSDGIARVIREPMDSMKYSYKKVVDNKNVVVITMILDDQS